MTVWDERKLAKRLRMQVKELGALHGEIQQLSERLCGVEADGDRAEQQRDRGESWSELSDVLENVTQEMADALDGIEAHFQVGSNR